MCLKKTNTVVYDPMLKRNHGRGELSMYFLLLLELPGRHILAHTHCRSPLALKVHPEQAFHEPTYFHPSWEAFWLFCFIYIC